MPKLIIIRGNSGSGKSSVAKASFEQAKKSTVLIEQDYYRFIFKPAGGTLDSKTIHKMIRDNTLTALEDGYDVILEGIFTVKSYKSVFEEIFKKHPENNYMFYFDVSFEETLKRHKTRKTKNLFTEEDMKDWYKPKDYSKYDFEQIIPENYSKNETINKIKKIAKI